MSLKLTILRIDLNVHKAIVETGDTDWERESDIVVLVAHAVPQNITVHVCSKVWIFYLEPPTIILVHYPQWKP